MVAEQLLVIAGAVAVIYVLIKVHLYTIRRLWVPKFEEELEATEAEEDDDEAEGGPEDRPTGWDHVG